MDVNGEMIRGHIDTIILLSLVDGDKDTNEIRRQIEEKSENKFSVKQGTFYSAMQRLVKQNLIREYRSSSTDGIRRKYFNLTEKGVKYVENNKQEWIKSRDLIDSLVSDEKSTYERIEVADSSLSEKKDLPIESNPGVKKEPTDEVTVVPVSTEVSFSADESDAKDYADTLKDFDARLDELLSDNSAIGESSEITDDLSESEEFPNRAETEEVIEDIPENDKTTADFGNSEEKNVEENEISKPDITEENSPVSAPDTDSEEIKSVERVQITSTDGFHVSDADSGYRLNDAYQQNDDEEEKRSYPFEIEDDKLYDREPEFKPTVEITVDQSIVKDNSHPKDEIIEKDEVTDDPVETAEVIPEDDVNEEKPDDIIERIDVVEPEVVETVRDEVEETTRYQENIVAPPSPVLNEKDDLFEFSDGAKTNRREYRSILSSLFPKEENNNSESDNAEAEQITESISRQDVSESVPTRAEVENFNDENVEEYEKRLGNENKHEVYVERYEKPVEKRNDDKKRVSGDASDFSDLYAMAAREGFKIKTSSNTNKFSGKRILIHKLNFFSSLTSYMLLFIEMLVLNFCLDGILGWQTSTKAIIALSAAVFPVVMLLIYIVDGKRRVKEISPFKDAIEISLIATFQIIIIILCVALFASVDFSDFKAVCEYVLLPFILAVNIPIFFIIKYALLATGKYYTGNEQ